MIVRGPRPADRFAQIHNDALGDRRLSFKARGLLAYLLSRPVGWQTSADRLATQGPDGRDAIRTGLQELERHGYLERTRTNDADGRWTHQHMVTDQPRTIDGLSDDGSPDGGSSADGKPADTSNKVFTKNVSTNTEGETPLPPDAEDAALFPERVAATPRRAGKLTQWQQQAFDQFWEVYPRRDDKARARRAWDKAMAAKVDVGAILAGAIRYRDDPNRDQRFTKQPATWLNAGSWENGPLPPRQDAQRGTSTRVQAGLDLAARFDAEERGQAPQIGGAR